MTPVKARYAETQARPDRSLPDPTGALEVV